MAMDAKLSLRQSQKLVMTTMLQQAIKLLPLSKLELVQLINNELLENPLLEENALLDEEAVAAAEETPENKKEEVNELDFNWDDYFQNRNVQTTSPFNDIDLPSLENTMAHEVSLTDYLSWQLALSSHDKLERCIGMFLIGNIDNDGYLKCDLEEAATHCKVEIGFIEKVLQSIQNFDPPGIASRNLRECSG